MTALQPKDILVVSPVVIWPTDRGNKLRILQMVRLLHAEGHRVHLVQTLDNPTDTPVGVINVRLRRWCASVRTVVHPRMRRFSGGWAKWQFMRRWDYLRGRRLGNWNACPPILCEAVADAMRSEPIDLAIINYARLARLVECTPAGIPTICDSHDVQYIRELRLHEAQGNAWPGADRYRQEELDLLKRFDYVAAINTLEQEYFNEHLGRQRVFYLPVSGSEFPYRPSPGDGPVLFVGAARQENSISLKWFLLRVLPRLRYHRPDIRLRVVGGIGEHFLDWPDKRIEWVRFAPTLEPHLEQCSCTIAPILAGGGIKIKVVESLAAGRAAVLTTMGGEGIGLTHGRDAWVADTPGRFADGILRLLGDDELRHAMERCGRDMYDKNFSLDVSRRALREAINRTCGGTVAEPRVSN